VKALVVLAALSGLGTTIYAGMPPERFQVKQASAEIRFVPMVNVASACKSKNTPYKTTLACTRKTIFGTDIILPDPCPFGDTERYAALVCHEIAHHSGGWSGNHEP